MKFQYIMLAIFGLMGVIAVIVFSVPSESEKEAAIAGASGNVVIWGTYPEQGMGVVLALLNEKYGESFTVSYVYKDSKSFDTAIVEALANDRGPDILLLPNDLILRHTNKIQLIPYTAIPQLTFQSTFAQAAEVYMRSVGLVAIPYAIDPIVMYWNRDLFSNASISVPPKYWNEFLSLTPQLTKRDEKTQDILQSTIAFGEYSNVTNAKGILATLFLQTGAKVVGIRDGDLVTDLALQRGEQFSPNQDIVSALRFYMDFSDPRKDNYSWSRALPSSRDQFLKGELAVYFDYASAYRVLKEKNPHLNFVSAPVPQIKDSTVSTTYARVHGLAVLKSSKNRDTAMIAVQQLLNSEYTREFAQQYGLPPVRRDLLNIPQTDATKAVAYTSAIRARTWLDPRPEQSEKAFQDMVESLSSGRAKTEQAVLVLASRLNEILPN
jgi:ABC-type glycerol-3-phosphate transport system substrate-binding protein